MPRRNVTLRCSIIVLIVLFAGGLLAQENQKVLTLDDYPKWKQITSTAISPDGNWITYGYRPNNADDTLYVKNPASDKVFEIPGGTRPAFADDSNWTAYRIDLPKKEREKLSKQKKTVTNKAELFNLNTEEKYTIDGASSFMFSENAKYFVVKKAKSDKSTKHNGTDLIIRLLEDGSTMNIGNVGSFSFNKTSTHLAYTIDADNKAGNGIYLLNLSSRNINRLDTGEADYSQMTWNEDGTVLAVLKGKEDEDYEQKSNVLLAYIGIEKDKINSFIYNPEEDSSFPENMVVSDKGRLVWSNDETKIFFGVKEQKKKIKPDKEKVANVDVWHWKDEVLQTAQMRRASRNRNFTYRSVVHLKNGKFIKLADEKMRNVSIAEDGKWGVGSDFKPYNMQFDLSGGKADYYRIDTSTGERKLIEKMLGRTLGISRGGTHFLFLQNKELYAYNLDTGEKAHLTTGQPGFFVNEDDDHQYDEKPAYRPVGWTKDGKSVIISHKFDLYQLSLDGKKAENFTKGIGEKEQIKFNYIRLDPEEKYIDLKQTMYLTAYGEWTKKAGFYSLQSGKEPIQLVYDDKSFGRLTKAKSADKVLFTRQTFVEFPDYYVSSLDFNDLKKVTDANPQQTEFAWGKRVLVDFVNTRGIKLQATLTLPANYQSGKKHPMIVYHYEKVSQNHHRYSMPRYDDRPHMSTYASDGYLVLMPDIVYANGTPGTNAAECILPAVEKVIELGYADPKRIGLQGHSWGGYQSSFLVTQTDLFACVVTGAPLTNLVSMYNILYGNSGNTNQPQIQYGQGRLGATPWTNFERYVSQSPVHQAPNIKVPFLILHGTEDGAVDWNQGLEYFVTGRRLGKEVILLSYPGEGHHLGKIENQKDFQIRMKQYFDHHLKGTEAPDWMVRGVPFLEKKSGK